MYTPPAKQCAAAPVHRSPHGYSLTVTHELRLSQRIGRTRARAHGSRHVNQARTGYGGVSALRLRTRRRTTTSAGGGPGGRAGGGDGGAARAAGARE
jgi:hypothetical protein